jgi:hypothetical protein
MYAHFYSGMHFAALPVLQARSSAGSLMVLVAVAMGVAGAWLGGCADL